MKRAIILIFCYLVISCANTNSTNQEYIGAWLVKYESGRLEKMSIYPNGILKISDRNDVTYSWHIENNILFVEYISKSEKSLVSKSRISKNYKKMKTEKYSGNKWYSKWSAVKKSNNPDGKFDLFELCSDTNNMDTLACKNVGSGETCCCIIPEEYTTKLTLKECKAELINSQNLHNHMQVIEK